MKLFILLVVAVATINAEEKLRFDHFQVFRVTPQCEKDLSLLQNIQEEHVYDFWTDVRGLGRPVDIMVPPHARSKFNNTISASQMSLEIYIEDVQHLIDNERPVKAERAMEWTDYHTLDEINQWLQELSEANPDTVTLVVAGKSYQERDILGVKVSFKPGNEKRTIFLESNIHAREWISSAVSTWILNELLTSQDPTIREIAESHDWYVVPIFNPDGFVYTHTTNRLWRKTLVPYGTCEGADPNRNWDYHWMDGGSSDNPCSETFAGGSAFSEPSTKSLSEFITGIGEDLRGYIALHSYSQYLLIPYGYTAEHLDNYQDLYNVGLKAVDSLAQRYGTSYETGNIVDLLYVASGGSMDWVKGTFSTPITYTYELRDTGRYGFILPAEQIIPCAEETLDSIITMLQEFNSILD